MFTAWLTDTVTSDLDRALHYTHLWGLDAVELRAVGRPTDIAPHVNEEKLLRRLREAETPFAAVRPGLFEGPAADRALWMNEAAALEETFAFCDRIGCPLVLASCFAPGLPADFALAAEALRRAGAVAARRGKRVAVCNAADGLAPTGALLARLLQEADHPALAAAWSPADAVEAGEDPAGGLEAVLPWLAYVRCRDVAVARGRAAGPAPIGEGAVGWPAQLRRLAAAGYDGPVSLRVVREPRPKTGLHDATQLIRMIRAAAR